MTRLLAALVAVIGVLVLAGGASAAKPVPVNSFTDFTVAATPPNPAGTICPGSALCYNGAAEPAIGVTPNGRFYASSENGLGGGTLAWLMAAQVPETAAIVTVAANLDTDDWTRIHDYSPLAGSLNPALMPPLSPTISQFHYVGARDRNVPPSIVQSFARRHPEARVIEVSDFDHECCWIEQWPNLLEEVQRARLGPRPPRN